MLDTVKNDPLVKSFTSVLRASDEEAYLHGLTVAEIVNTCFRYNGVPDWNDDIKKQILTGCILIDLGKAFLPFGLQHKQSVLSDDEKSIIEMHPRLGAIAVKDSDIPRIAMDIILMHHANADGTGYPVISANGQKLPLMSRDFIKSSNGIPVPDHVWFAAYADRFGAMINERPYRNGILPRQAWKEMLFLIETNKLDYRYKPVFEAFVNNVAVEGIVHE